MKRIRRILKCVALGIIIFGTVAAAEDLPLQPIDRPEIPGEVRCMLHMPFFVATVLNGAERIIFWYQAPDGKTERASILKTRMSVEIKEGQQVPTYEGVLVDGQDGAIIRLDQAKYEQFQACLPTPKTKGAQQ